MATDGKGGRVLAIGRAASQLVGRGGKARTVRPVRDGNGVDYGVAGAEVPHPICRPRGPQPDLSPPVILSVGPLVTRPRAPGRPLGSHPKRAPTGSPVRTPI